VPLNGYVKVTVVTEQRRAFHRGHGVQWMESPRFHSDQGIISTPKWARIMLYTTERGCFPGIIGMLGHDMGQAGVNIAHSTLGRLPWRRGRLRSSMSNEA